MRFAALKIIVFIGIIFALPLPVAVAADLESFQSLCKSIGFKPGTVDFGECVLELDRRAKAIPKSEPAKEVVKGDGTPDDLTCGRYGFKVGSDKYADCRLKLDMARRDFEREQREYLAKQRKYEQQLAAIQAEAERKRQSDNQRYWACVGDCGSYSGSTMVGCMSQCKAQITGSAYRPRPEPPGAPAPFRQRYVINGQTITCREFGTVITCE
jgi:hypothetical protein